MIGYLVFYTKAEGMERSALKKSKRGRYEV